MVREDSSWLAGWCVAGGPANGIGSWIPLWEGWGRLERVHHIIWRVCEKSESDYGLGFKKLPHDSRTTFWLLSPPCQSGLETFVIWKWETLVHKPSTQCLGEISELLHFFRLKTSLQFCQFKFFRVFVSKEPYYHPGVLFTQEWCSPKRSWLHTFRGLPLASTEPCVYWLVRLNKLLPFPHTTLQ